jgi:hypothetical protein
LRIAKFLYDFSRAFRTDTQVRGLQIGDSITIVENKTGKKNVLVINKSSFDALQNFFKLISKEDDDFLFSGRKGNDPITIPSLNRLIKGWTDAINLKGKYGMWSRKVFVALLRRYDIKPFRYYRQRHTTVMANVPKTFVDETLWPEFQELNKILQSYIELTFRSLKIDNNYLFSYFELMKYFSQWKYRLI